MDLHEFLGLLQNVKGPTGKGEYICRCPAHDDSHASLWVTEGDKGIIFKCQAGCTKDQVLRALGLSVYDLLNEASRKKWDAAAAKRGVNPRELDSAPRSSAPSAAAPKKTSTASNSKRQPKTYDSYQAAYGKLGRLVCTYKYTDSNGHLLFEVARIQQKDGKTFRQHRPLNPDSGSLFPIVCNVPPAIRGNTIYHQAEVESAVRQGRTIYVAEGEKDVETLIKMGYAATTSPMGADHWGRGHSEHLHGAHVVVIPDNDESGEKYCSAIVDNTLDLAQSVRVVHLVDGFPHLPKKGDITDLAEAIGMEKAKKVLDSLTMAAAPVQMDMYKRALTAYNNLPGYCIANGCTCQRMEDSSKVLGTFVALPTREITKDDGAIASKWLEIMGWSADGRPLERQMVPMAKFPSMSWPLEGWGLTANIMPGNTVKDRLRSAIAAAGAQVAKRHTIYTHTGWRRIDGHWAYLYQGGCVGMENTTVDLDPGLGSYTLSGTPDDCSPADAAVSSFSMTSVIAERVSVPLLGMVYLAPLREFLAQAGTPPAFILFLRGTSGTKKSTASALALSHYGQFNDTTPPASFGDTTNSVRRKAFVVKDMPLLIDDYHPSANLQERRKMEQTAQSLARAFGNLTARGRMSSDLTMQVAMPPRSVAMMTGEEIPDIGDSGMARFYVVEVDHGDVPSGEELTELQQRARAGELRAAMRAYVEWLLPQADVLPRQLGQMFLEYRARATENFEGSRVHGRTVGAVAQLMIGLTYMLRFLQSVGLYDTDGVNAMLEEYWQIIVGNSAEQVRTTREESAVNMFMAATSEMLSSRVATVVDMSIGSESHAPAKGMVGYMDEKNYYFMGESLYGAVVHFYRDQDRVFPASRAALYKQLRSAGIIEEAGGDGKTAKVKRVGGRTLRLIWIPRWRLDGGNAPGIAGTQEHMDWTEVDAQDVPFKEE